MSSNYDLRSALADALPAAGPTRAAVKAMDDIGYKADPQNNDMKELFVGLDLATSGSSSGKEAQPAASLAVAAASGEEGAAAAAAVAAEPAEIRAGSGGGPSAAQALLDYRRERKAAQEAADLEAATLSAAGKGKGKGPETAVAAAPAIGGVGLARATELASLEMEEAADDERLLKKRNLSKTAARMSSKQKRRRKNGKEHGTTYEDKHAGKVVNKSKRKGRMLAMKQMY